jgi:two-component system, NarL family, nitrate/nitrite response regulator NarL
MLGGTGDAVIIANSQRMFVDALVSAVQSEGFTVVHAATTRAGLVEAVKRHQNAICLCAWTFTDGGLAEVMTQVRSTAPSSRIVVLSSDSDPMTLSAALNVGVQGFIHTSRGLDVLLDAVRRLHLGEIVIEASLSDTSTPGSTEARRVRKLATYLTPREYECLAMVVSGMDTAAMSRRLGVSRTTIRSHVQSMLMKLSVHSRLEAAALAVEHHLLTNGEPARLASVP